MSAMRVLLLSNAITPDRPGGLERYVRELGTALSRAGAEVTILARRVDEDDPGVSRDDDGVEIRRFATPSREGHLYAVAYPWASVRAVRTAVRAESSTHILHSHFPLQGLPLALGGVSYIHTFHAPVHRELAAERSYPLPRPAEAAAVAMMRSAEGRILRDAGDVLVLSQFMRSQAQELGAAQERVSLLAGGIDAARFSPGAPISHPWAEGEGPLLFTARRMVPRTGVLELVEAFAEIAQAIPAARLALAGRGPLEREIRERISALGLEARVAVVGWISDEELIGWYRAADLVVMPTQELEGFGLTTAEALACGTPVVATPVGANPEVLGRLDPALLCADATPPAIAATVIELLRQPERLRGLAGRARAAVLPEFSWSSVADRHMAIYERYRPPVSGAGHSSASPGGPIDPSGDLLGLLRSPATGARLERAGGRLRSLDGQESFPLIAGIPVLLSAHSAFSAADYLARGRQCGRLAAGLRRFLRRLLPSLSHNLSAARNIRRFSELLAPAGAAPPLVLVVGGAIVGEGMQTLIDHRGISLVEADVAIGPRTHVICDAHELPFADGVFDGVVCQAVLEHVADPQRVVGEIHRVLRPGGLVYSEIPFMQQVHEGAYDFTRFSYNGHRRLFRCFQEIDAGATAGPGMALAWSIRSLLRGIAGQHRLARAAVDLLATLGLFWLKYLDRPLMRSSAALDGASGTFFLGRSIQTPRSDREIIAGYRGANSGFSVSR